MPRFEDRISWFGAGVVLGAALAGACFALARQSQKQITGGAHDDSSIRQADEASSAGKRSDAVATDIFEFKGHVIHIFCHVVTGGLYKASCDIWEDGAVVLEAGAVGTTYPTPEEAKAAAHGWAKHWVDSNG
ncbi:MULTISPECIES: hypothetical protein [unclassified Cupriavidus]|uniref:hypothetical protein n=1 Tax=Cupriavidus TaxID=106589 RepID=UPI00226E939A|nr:MULTISPECIES: hypothetical protein [unclassified Cupriavidus]MCY0854849.1 hypothetical protein [Cupriavidus sp. D39]MDW3682900.1 hypothetical protein [Cupriavidus sp. CV2]